VRGIWNITFYEINMNSLKEFCFLILTINLSTSAYSQLNPVIGLESEVMFFKYPERNYTNLKDQRPAFFKFTAKLGFTSDSGTWTVSINPGFTSFSVYRQVIYSGPNGESIADMEERNQLMSIPLVIGGRFRLSERKGISLSTGIGYNFYISPTYLIVVSDGSEVYSGNSGYIYSNHAQLQATINYAYFLSKQLRLQAGISGYRSLFHIRNKGTVYPEAFNYSALGIGIRIAYIFNK